MGLVAVEVIAGNDGFLLGTPGDNSEWVAGHIDGGLDLPGTADYFTHTHVLNTSVGTISHWVRPVNFMVAPMVIYYESDGSDHWWYNGWGQTEDILEIHTSFRDDGRFGFFFQNGPTYREALAAIPPPDGQWSHLAATWDVSGMARVYVNGVEGGSADLTVVEFNGKVGSIHRVGEPGDLGAARGLVGAVDDIRVYDRVLTPAEIAVLAAQ